MQTPDLRKLFAAFAIVGAAACGGGVDTTGDDVAGDDTVDPVDEWDERLEEREVDYNAALRIAALRLTGELPTLVEIKSVAEAPIEQQADVYASIVGGYLDDPRFARQMVAFWQDTLKMGDEPDFDSAAAFAAMAGRKTSRGCTRIVSRVPCEIGSTRIRRRRVLSSST